MVNVCVIEKSLLAKCLLFFITVLVMILVAFAVILVNRKPETRICQTEQCLNQTAELTKYLNIEVKPCEDFYALSCGTFHKNRRYFSPPTAEDELEAMLRQMVRPEDSKPFVMQKSFYLSCSNLGAIEINDDETVLDLFYSIGDWPVIRGAYWDGTSFEWTELAKKCRRLGLKFDWFLDFSVYPDVNDTGLNILKIDVPKYSPIREEEIFPRQKLFTKVAVSLGAPEKLAHYETERTIMFENALRTLAEEHRNETKHLHRLSLPKIRIHEVQALWPNIRWLELINNVTGLRLGESDYVIFHEVIDYIKDLNKLIFGTPKRIVADFMMWKIVEEIWPYLSHPAREKFEEFYEKYQNQEPEMDRQKFCIAEARKLFPLNAEAEFIRRKVTQEKRQLVKEMLLIIRNKIIALVRKATWINKGARSNALYKLETMDFLIGGPWQIFDEFGFAEDMGTYGFVFKSQNVIDMLTERQIRFYDHYFGGVNKLVTNKTSQFYENFVNISRFLFVNGNTLVIPADVLRDISYNPKLPNYFNYATLGTTLAYEIFLHAFDLQNKTTGSEELYYYNSSNVDAFGSAITCLMKEASFIHSSEFKRTWKMGKMLADFVAPIIAYESYKDWALTHPQEPKLPALEFNPSQLFWIHASKLSCKNIHSKYDRDYSRFKINAPLRNLQSFAEDFKCADNSKMISLRQCRVL